MSSIRWFWVKYSVLFRTEWTMMLAYRAESIIWMLGALIQPLVSMAIWTAISSQAPDGKVGGYAAHDLIIYFLGVMVVERLTRAWNVWNLDSEIRDGTFTPKLLRPFHPIHWEINQNLVYKTFYVALMIPAWFLLSWFLPLVRLTLDGETILWFILLILISSAFRFVVCQLFGLMSFWTSRALAMYGVYEMLHFFLAGRIAPMNLLPEWLIEVNRWLPFYFSVGFPVDLLSGRFAGQSELILHGVLVLFAWTIALCGLLWVQWRAGLKSFGAIGG